MLQTPYVFLDTEAFVRARLLFDTGSLKRIAELSSSRRIHLVVPETTYREVQKKIRDHVEEFLAKWGKLLGGAPALKHLADDGRPLVPDIDGDKLATELTAKFDTFLNTAEAQRIPFSEAVAEQVMDAYFNRRPPFGMGDKKHQFPDAFALKALEVWATDEEVRVYVVSRDGDIRSVCAASDAFLYLEDLAELFTLIEVLDAHALKLVQSVEEQIKRQVVEQLPGYGFIIVDEDGDVENVEVVDVELLDVTVQDVEDDVVRFLTPARVTIRADVSYWRSDNATYDSEDKVLIYHDRAEHKIEDVPEIQLLGSVVATDPTLTTAEDVFVEFDTSQTFVVDPHAVYYEDM